MEGGRRDGGLGGWGWVRPSNLHSFAASRLRAKHLQSREEFARSREDAKGAGRVGLGGWGWIRQGNLHSFAASRLRAKHLQCREEFARSREDAKERFGFRRVEEHPFLARS